MSKLNPTVKNSNSKMSDERLAGGFGMKAAKQTPFEDLRRAVLANLLWEDIAYIDGMSVSNEIKRLIPLCEPEDVARLAVEARIAQKLRHIPLFIVREMCRYDNFKSHVARILPLIINRADMITDFVALYWKENKEPLINQAKKGLAKSFENFDEYQFGKYDRNSEIKLRDVMFLTHPKAPNKEKEELYKKIAERKLSTPDTWEVALSRGDDKKTTWERLINTNKIGGLAFLRNLRNMVKANVDYQAIQNGFNKLHSTMLMPLDFLKAANEVPQYEDLIEKAMLASYKNLPKLKGKTLFIVDVSGSMSACLSSRSSFSRLDAACAMALLAINQCEDCTLVATAGNDWERKHKTCQVNTNKKGFGLINDIKAAESKLGGGGIFTRQCLEWCQENVGTDYDRIIIFSDSQDCDLVKKLPSPFGKYNYICDVSSNTKGINYKGVWTAEISGFSEHFLTYIGVCEGLVNAFSEME